MNKFFKSFYYGMTKNKKIFFCPIRNCWMYNSILYGWVKAENKMSFKHFDFVKIYGKK